MIVAGHSAGDTLASLVGSNSNGNSPRSFGVTAKVDGWVSNAGISDSRRGTNATVNTIGAARLVDVQGRAAATSTTTHLGCNDPPGYVVHGDLDTVVPIAQTYALLEDAANKGIGGHLYYDIVDRCTVWCRNHAPQCGVNASIFNYWVGRSDDRAL